MKLPVVLRYVGLVLVIDGVFLLLSALISALYGDGSFRPLVYSALITVLFGVFPMVFVPATKKISNTEGLLIVVAGWLMSCLYGTLPYLLWGGEFTFTNAWFESVSGFTTTGATILIDVEAVPPGLLFWRAATHWIGGLGIILFVLSVLPAMGLAGMVLYRTEMSPLAQDSFRQSAKTALRILLTIYVGLTVAEILALLAAGMNVFDAVTHAFATIATGGFSPKNLSVAYYDNVVIELIIIIFMVLSGMHFGLLFSTVVEKKAGILKSTVAQYYLAAIVVSIGITTLVTYGHPYTTWLQSLRHSAFQVVSVSTSTGLATADSSIWPPLGQVLLMFLALQCACVGSTGGGIKADRIVLFAKAVRRQLKLLQHPHAVVNVWIDGKSIAAEALAAGVLYIVSYLMIVFVGGTILTGLGVRPLEAFSGVIATTGNVGPGLGAVGSMGNFSAIPAAGKWVLAATMLLGRLEIYGLLVVFLPRIWAKGKTTS
jgi:trk system potassium uptake protein TrkH